MDRTAEDTRKRFFIKVTKTKEVENERIYNDIIFYIGIAFFDRQRIFYF